MTYRMFKASHELEVESRLQYVRFPDVSFVTLSLIFHGNAQHTDKIVENFVIKSVKSVSR